MFKIGKVLEVLDSDILFGGLTLGHEDLSEATLANFVYYSVMVQNLKPAMTQIKLLQNSIVLSLRR